ncbi:MAG TPA: hypothetical protein VFK57_19455 [Vicinamibacterales bacterium]|nr:hypothetical protein [Vicinamibacterales bacterium]
MPQFSKSQQRAIESLARDLDGIFGPRLVSLIAYPGHQADGSVHSCALVEGLTFRDLTASLPLTESWHHRGTSVPLLLSPEELRRTIDIFPLEYATMMADYAVVRGSDPFAGVSIPPEDVRRSVEGLAKSHLIHLREAFLESHGETLRIASLIVASAAPLRALLTHIARLPEAGPGPEDTSTPSDESLAALAELRMGIPRALIRTVLATSADGASTIADPSHLLGPYIDASKRIWEYVDRWRA